MTSSRTPRESAIIIAQARLDLVRAELAAETAEWKRKVLLDAVELYEITLASVKGPFAHKLEDAP